MSNYYNGIILTIQFIHLVCGIFNPFTFSDEFCFI